MMGLRCTKIVKWDKEWKKQLVLYAHEGILSFVFTFLHMHAHFVIRWSWPLNVKPQKDIIDIALTYLHEHTDTTIVHCTFYGVAQSSFLYLCAIPMQIICKTTHFNYSISCFTLNIYSHVLIIQYKIKNVKEPFRVTLIHMFMC